MNMFTDPVIGPPLTIIFIICCFAGAVFLVIENWPKKKQLIQKTKVTSYENYIIVDDEIIYPTAVVKHVDIQA